MTVLVNWQGAAVLAAGLTVLIGLPWLLKGGRAAVRTRLAVAVADMLVGLAAGSVVMVAVGAVLLAVDFWCLASLRDGGRR